MSDTAPLSDRGLSEFPSRWGYFRNAILGAVLAVLLGLGIVVFLVVSNAQQADKADEQEGKKDNVIKTALQQCELLLAKGENCVLSPSEIRKGEPPPKPFTEDQIRSFARDAVADYLKANPAPKGLTPQQVVDIAMTYLRENAPPGRLPTAEQLSAAIRAEIAANPTLRGDAGPSGAPGGTGPQGPQGDKGEKGDGPSQAEVQAAVEQWMKDHPPNPCPEGYAFQERRVDEIVCVKTVIEPTDPEPTATP